MNELEEAAHVVLRCWRDALGGVDDDDDSDVEMRADRLSDAMDRLAVTLAKPRLHEGGLS